MAITIVHIHVHVRDYDTWKPVFDEVRALRQQHGAAGHVVYRTLDDPNEVMIVTEFATPEGARAFVADPALRAAMERAGVEMPAEVKVCEEMERLRY